MLYFNRQNRCWDYSGVKNRITTTKIIVVGESCKRFRRFMLQPRLCLWLPPYTWENTDCVQGAGGRRLWSAGSSCWQSWRGRARSIEVLSCWAKEASNLLPFLGQFCSKSVLVAKTAAAWTLPSRFWLELPKLGFSKCVGEGLTNKFSLRAAVSPLHKICPCPQHSASLVSALGWGWQVVPENVVCFPPSPPDSAIQFLSDSGPNQASLRVL